MNFERVAPVNIDLDYPTLMRLEALAMLQGESSPGGACDRESALQNALKVGLDLLLAELLGPRPACSVILTHQGREH